MLKVVVKGTEQIVRKLQNAAKQAKDAEKVVHKCALLVAGEAKQRVPVDTGHLRRSITATTHREGRKIIGRVGTNVYYAKFIEFGRKRVIEPVRARALRFVVKTPIGKHDRVRLRRDVVFAKRAEAGKPGQKTANWERLDGDRIAKPFLRPALKAALPKIKQIVKDFLARLTK